MATAVADLKQIDVEIDCPAPGCEAGRIKHEDVRIDPKFNDRHKKHAYLIDPETRQMIGANCDCPRLVGRPTFGTCQACKGTGKQNRNLVVPRVGQKVNVIDTDLLAEIFGDKVPKEPGTVFNIQGPEEHRLELRSNIGIGVTWDRLTTLHKPYKNQEIEVWVFDLLELALVGR